TTFLDTSCFTMQVTDVVQFSTTNFTMASNFDFSNTWSVYWESTFHTNTVRYFTDCVSFAHTRTAAFDYNTFKDLYTFSVAFDDFRMYSNSISRTEIRDV